MLVYCFYLLMVGGFVAPLSISGKHHGGLHSIGGGTMISWEPRTMISSEDYPCTKEGLYTHPTNCSRFYRCVDFTGESRIFSRYLFECPEGMVFASTIDACVPGVCPDQAGKLPSEETGDEVTTPATVSMLDSSTSVDPASESEPGSTESPSSAGEAAGSGVENSTDAASTSAPTEAAGQSEADGAGGAGESGSSSGTAEKEIEGLPPVIDQDKSVVSPDQVSGAKEPCKTKYVQHERYCNLFHLCDDPNSLFSCYDGTAFSTERQMCRLSQFEEALCEGKEVFVPSAEIFRSAFNWNEVGVVPLEGNPVYNSNPYFFMNIGDAFEKEEGIQVPSFEQTLTPAEPSRFLTQPAKPFEMPSSVQNRYKPISSTRLTQTSVEDPKERKKSKFSSLLGGITDLLFTKRKQPSTRTSEPSINRKTIVPKVTRKDKNEKTKEPSSFDYSPFLSSFSDMTSFSDLLNSADPSKTSISSSPFMSTGVAFPFTGSVPSAAFSPYKGLRQSQSPFLNQGFQLSYAPSQSSMMYSPYAGIYPYAFSSPDVSSIFRTQSASPSNVFGQAQMSSPFSSSGSFFPYSPSYTGSLGMIASPYGFLYDPTRNSLIPVAIPPSYMNSIYASLLGSNPYSSLMQLSEKEAEEFLGSAMISESNAADKFETKRKESTTKNSKKNIPQQFSFLPSLQDDSSFSSLVPAFEARNQEGETYQVIPLSKYEVDTLAKQGLLERATKFNKPFTYKDLDNLEEGEIILANFSKKK